MSCVLLFPLRFGLSHLCLFISKGQECLDLFGTGAATTLGGAKETRIFREIFHELVQHLAEVDEKCQK
ncbi:hypothetical protein Tsubulata_041829, partial [Turnera subulata]